MNALPAGIILPIGTRPIRPPDRAVRGTTLSYMRVRSDEAVRRLVHLAFRDAHSALDLTYAAGRFWRDPLPPGLTVTSNNWDAEASTDLHVDFTATGLATASYDLVIYDPPHVADGGTGGLMGRRYGTVRTAGSLRDLIVAGAREAWRVAAVGILVKVTDHHHGGRAVEESDWVKAAIGAPIYTKLSTMRVHGAMLSGRWKAERVPRSNGAVYLVFRHGGGGHVDFDALWRRHVLRLGPAGPACARCKTPLPAGARSDARVCSSRCRQWLYDERQRRARRAARC